MDSVTCPAQWMMLGAVLPRRLKYTNESHLFFLRFANKPNYLHIPRTKQNLNILHDVLLDLKTMAEAAIRLLISRITPQQPVSSVASPSASSPTDLVASHQSQFPPVLLRRSSCGSTTSVSSTETIDTELQPWRYTDYRKSRGREQDEVVRKRRETSAKRDRQADRAWKEFWG
jgi:hypothetical protein